MAEHYFVYRKRSGRVLRSLLVKNSSAVVDVATLHAGTYLMRWRSADGSTSVAGLVKE